MSRQDDPPSTGKPRIPRTLVHRWGWAFWLLVTGIAVVGLRSYRVDNALSDWMPHLKSGGLTRSYVLIGGQRAAFDPDQAASILTRLESVAACISPQIFEQAGPGGPGGPGLHSIAEDFVLSRDGRYAGVFCFAAPGVDDDHFLNEVMTSLADLPGTNPDELAIGGPAVFHVQLNRWSQQRLPVVMGLIVVTGFAMMWWLTGRARAAATSTLAVVLSQVILLGAISWFNRPVDMAVSMVPPMMMALGFSFAAHRALRPDVSLVLMLCLLTTAAGIGSFAAVQVPPIRGFALYGVAGLGLVWSAVMTLVQPLPKGRASLSEQPDRFDRVGRVLTDAVRRRPGWIVAGAVFLTVVGALLTPLLRFESNPMHYFPAESAIARDYDTLEANLTGMLPFEVTVWGDADPTPLLEQTAGVRKVIDTRLIDPTASTATYWCLADTDSLVELSGQAKRWRAWATQHGVQLDWGGVARQLSEIENTVYRAAVIALPSMILLVGVVTWLVWRSIYMMFFSTWVNLFPVAVLVAIAAATRWPIGLPSLMIGAIAVGVAVDDTLHLMWALKRDRSEHVFRSVLAGCWRPCVGSSLIAAAGMAMFGLCPFGPTAQFGLLLSIAILAALAGDMLVLPALLSLFKPRRDVRESSMDCDRGVDGAFGGDRGDLRGPRAGSAPVP